MPKRHARHPSAPFLFVEMGFFEKINMEQGLADLQITNYEQLFPLERFTNTTFVATTTCPTAKAKAKTVGPWKQGEATSQEQYPRQEIQRKYQSQYQSQRNRDVQQVHHHIQPAAPAIKGFMKQSTPMLVQRKILPPSEGTAWQLCANLSARNRRSVQVFFFCRELLWRINLQIQQQHHPLPKANAAKQRFPGQGSRFQL